MNYQEVLNKKKERLSKYTGRKLKLKQRAYEKALSRFGTAAPATQKSPKSAAPKVTKKPEKAVVVETGDPEWSVHLPGETGGVITVHASSEKKARAAARSALKLRALPAGTKVEKR